MPRTALALCTLLTVVLAVTSAHALTATAEWNIDTTTLHSFGGFGGCSTTLVPTWRGQTFVAQTAGRLVSASVRMFRSGTTELPLTAEIYAVDASGYPTGAPLYSEEDPMPSLNYGMPADVYTIVFSGATPILQAGKSYALVFVSPTSTPSLSQFTLNGGIDAEATYADGHGIAMTCSSGVWNDQSADLDWAFRVMVDDTVPTSSASWGALKARF